MRNSWTLLATPVRHEHLLSCAITLLCCPWCYDTANEDENRTREHHRKILRQYWHFQRITCPSVFVCRHCNNPQEGTSTMILLISSSLWYPLTSVRRGVTWVCEQPFTSSGALSARKISTRFSSKEQWSSTRLHRGKRKWKKIIPLCSDSNALRGCVSYM